MPFTESMKQCRAEQSDFKHISGDYLFISSELPYIFEFPTAFGFPTPGESCNTSHYEVREGRIIIPHYKQQKHLIMHNNDESPEDKFKLPDGLIYHAGTVNSSLQESIYQALGDSSNLPASLDHEEEGTNENAVSSSSHPADGNNIINFGNADFDDMRATIDCDGGNINNQNFDPCFQNESLEGNFYDVQGELGDTSRHPNGTSKKAPEQGMFLESTAPSIYTHSGDINFKKPSASPTRYLATSPRSFLSTGKNRIPSNIGSVIMRDYQKKPTRSIRNGIIGFLKSSYRKSNARYTPIEDIAIRCRKERKIPWKYVLPKRRTGNNLQVHLSQTLNKTVFPNPDANLDVEEKELLNRLIESSIETFLHNMPKICLKSTGASLSRQDFEYILSVFMDCKMGELDMLINGKDFSSDSDSSNSD